MAAPGADSIPATAEGDATGEIAALYEDLRVTLGVPFVNLIWRHLATIPGGLAWTWTLTKPLYVSGELDRLSSRTSALVSLPSLVPLPDCVWDTAAIDDNARQTIAAMIESYNHANGVNFLALLTAVSVLRDGLPPASGARSMPAVARHALPTPELPPLPGLSELPPPVLALVRQLDEFGRLGSSDAVASLYRHLAHWPAFLSVAYTAIAPLHRYRDLATAQEGVIAFGRSHCTDLAGLVNRELPGLSPDARSAVLRALDEFTRLMIGRMIVMGKAMRALISAGTA
jgi:hypothetical protein